MANILVTGGAGYIGNVISSLALQRGHKVRVVDALWFGSEIPLIHMSNPNYTFVKGDIRDKGLLGGLLEDIDIVIHAAAVVGEPASDKYQDLTRQINRDASKDLMDKAVAKGVKGFVFLSTCSNYGIAEGMATEETPLKPLSLYASTKVDAEEHLMKKTGSMDWVVCRLSTVYGSSPRMRFDLTVNDFSLNGYRNKYVDLFLPYTYRPYIHVYDVANVLVTIVENFGKVKNNVLNVGFEGENYQKIQIAEAVKKCVPDMKIEIVKSGVDKRDYQVDFSKLKKCLGIENKYRMEDGVREVVGLLKADLIKDPNAPRYYNTNPDLGSM